jgi:hypothetical protein
MTWETILISAIIGFLLGVFGEPVVTYIKRKRFEA